MSAFLSPQVLSAGIGLLGSLFGGDDGGDARENRKQTLKLIKEKGVATRKGAEAAGFNPLTYLASGVANSNISGGLGNSPAPLASFEALSRVVDAVAQTRDKTTADAENRKKAEKQLEKVAADKKRTNVEPSVVEPMEHVFLANPPEPGWSLGATRPISRMENREWEIAPPVLVTDVNGVKTYISAQWADALDVKWGDQLTGEHYEQRAGELGGTVMLTPKIPQHIMNADPPGELYDAEPSRNLPPLTPSRRRGRKAE